MSFGFWGDSTCQGMAQRMSVRLGQTVKDAARGGDTIGQVKTRLLAAPASRNWFRCGHNMDLRQGKVAYILDTMATMLAASAPGSVVLQLSLNDDIAYGTTATAKNIMGWWHEVNAGFAQRFGAAYVPIQDMMIAHARAYLPNLTAEEVEDMNRGLLPRRWRASVGNDGHLVTAARDVCADLLFAHHNGAPTPAPAPEPEPTPVPTPAPTKTAWQRFLDWLRR